MSEESEPRQATRFVSHSSNVSDSERISLTGNPFVDTGLAVIASRRALNNIEDLTLGDLKAVHKDGETLAREMQPLKAFTMIFTANSLLTQPSIKDKEKRIKMHAVITTEFLNAIGAETENAVCVSCGNERTLNLSDAVNKALSSFGEKPKDRFVGRDWFPLAGSPGSDAQALPAATKPPSLCAKCIFAVQYLPLGTRAFGRGELAVFQSTDTKFWYELARDTARKIKNRVDDGNYDIFGSDEGRSGLASQLLQLFSEMQRRKDYHGLAKDTVLFAWRFTNFGSSPNIDIEEIPNLTLEFLWTASVDHDLSQEIQNILKRERRIKAERYSFFTCISQCRNYEGLYPGKFGKEKKYEGVSTRLFALFQTKILGRGLSELKSAYEIANSKISDLKLNTKQSYSKEVQRLARKESFHQEKARKLFRQIMAQLARQGKFNLRNYLRLFPYTGDGVSVSFEGWDLIRYYFGKIASQSSIEFLEEGQMTEKLQSESSPIYCNVFSTASDIFNRYVEQRGVERFEKEILRSLERGKLGLDWLRSQFTILARSHDEYNYMNWLRLCYSEDFKPLASELLFQFRLLWLEWLKDPSHVPSKGLKKSSPVPQGLAESSGLPEKIARGLVLLFTNYAENRGLKRVRKDILEPLQKRETGISWFENRLVGSGENNITEEEWEEFLHDSQGNTLIAERTFQMTLFLNNLYRMGQGRSAIAEAMAR
jgi:hypothetical protein